MPGPEVKQKIIDVLWRCRDAYVSEPSDIAQQKTIDIELERQEEARLAREAQARADTVAREFSVRAQR